MTNDFDYQPQSSQLNDVAVGYFTDAEDAQRAIFELRDEGFNAQQVGAAFHNESEFRPSSSQQQAETSGSDKPSVSGKHVSIGISPGVTGAGSGSTGARSDDTAVTPAGLATGSGTSNAGATRPGPITGFASHHIHMPGTRPDPSEPIESSAVVPEGGVFPSTGGFSNAGDSEANETGWWSKLKEFFGADESGKKQSGSAVANDSSLNFGTGEGHLGVTQPAINVRTTSGVASATAASTSTSDGGLYGSESGYDHDYSSGYDYSSQDLEGSFDRLGVPQNRARYVSRQLSGGGAVVTVKAQGRASEAEQILERNGASVRHEGLDSTATAEGSTPVTFDQSPDANRLVLFGDLISGYRRHFPAEDTERKIS
ncbi:MAG TPA: hypothetical protein VGD64_15450 [Acidisarcina sp.]